jgi:hypothetical protein
MSDPVKQEPKSNLPQLPNVADMTSVQLLDHIERLDESHRMRMRNLRALARCKADAEADK